MYLCTLKIIGMTGQKTPTALGTEKIGKLLMQYAIPAIIAMTASSLYNMVDSIFIGHGVGPMAISGLALTFPLMNLAAAGTKRLRYGATCAGKCIGVEYHHRACFYDTYPYFSRSYPLFFRRQRRDCGVCPRLYEGDPLW